MHFRIFKQVPRILFGQGTLARLSELLPLKPEESDYYTFVIDSAHKNTGLLNKLSLQHNDMTLWVKTDHEPSTDLVDELRDYILKTKNKTLPKAVIGIGGGSAMDVSKAIAVMLTNPGSAAEYQGWDLVKKPAIFKVGVPTLSGSGSEASRTTVLFSKNKKFGINSDFSMFDAILCDSTLLKTVEREQRFYTAMDCYIHCIESLEGTMINDLAKAYASRALELCRNVFLGQGTDDELMVASFLGGASIVNSEVGICHALSYGLSLELGYHHGIANCIAFRVLDEYYGTYVSEFRDMLNRLEVRLPQNVSAQITDDKLERMIEMTFRMERPLTNALGENWREKFTRDKVIALYRRM